MAGQPNYPPGTYPTSLATLTLAAAAVTASFSLTDIGETLDYVDIYVWSDQVTIGDITGLSTDGKPIYQGPANATPGGLLNKGEDHVRFYLGTVRNKMAFTIACSAAAAGDTIQIVGMVRAPRKRSRK